MRPEMYSPMPTTPLLALTILIDLIGLGVTIWLGLMFLVNQSVHKWARVAAGLMWLFSGTFALVLLQLANPLVADLPWLPYILLRYIIIPMPLAWFAVVQQALPERVRPLLVRFAPFAAGATIVTVVVTAIVGPLAALFGIAPQLWEWVFYPLFMLQTTICLLPVVTLSWRALHATANPAYRASARWLGIASGVALLATLYRIGAFWATETLVGLPASPGDIGLMAAIILLGVGLVLRQIGEGETNTPAFFYALANAIAMSLLYSLVVGALSLYLNISWVVLVAIVPLAVTTHWLTDWLRTTFDRWFYRAPVQRLRNDLRQMLHTLDYEQSLAEQMRPLLVRLAGQISAPCLAVFVREEGGWHSVATFPPDLTIADESLPMISKRMPVTLTAPAPIAAGAAWAVPLADDAGDTGALVAWSRTTQSFNDVELQLLDEGSYQVTLVLEGWRAQNERLQEIESLVSTYREEAEALRKSALEVTEAEITATATTATPPEEMRSWVEDAARNLHNVGYLGQHPIASLKSITPYLPSQNGQPLTHLERGQAVRKLFEVLIERLRPAVGMPPEPLPSEWRHYMVLHAAYIEKVPNREIMSRLYIGEGTFHRARRQALESLSTAITELEYSSEIM
jgi:hypothetical protein